MCDLNINVSFHMLKRENEKAFLSFTMKRYQNKDIFIFLFLADSKTFIFRCQGCCLQKKYTTHHFVKRSYLHMQFLVKFEMVPDGGIKVSMERAYDKTAQ